MRGSTGSGTVALQRLPPPGRQYPLYHPPTPPPQLLQEFGPVLPRSLCRPRPVALTLARDEEKQNPKAHGPQKQAEPSGFIVSSEVFFALPAGTAFSKRLRGDPSSQDLDQSVPHPGLGLDWAGRRREQRWVWQENGTKRVKDQWQAGASTAASLLSGSPLGLPSRRALGFCSSSAIPRPLSPNLRLVSLQSQAR